MGTFWFCCFTRSDLLFDRSTINQIIYQCLMGDFKIPSSCSKRSLSSCMAVLTINEKTSEKCQLRVCAKKNYHKIPWSFPISFFSSMNSCKHKNKEDLLTTFCNRK